MKKFFLLFCFFLYSLQAKSTFTWEWGNVYTTPNFSNFFASDEQYEYAYRIISEQHFPSVAVLFLDKKNLNIQETYLYLDLAPKLAVHFLKIFKKDNKFFVFWQVFEDQQKQIKLCVQSFDLQGKKIGKTETLELLTGIETKDRSVYFYFADTPTSDFLIGNAMPLRIDGKPGLMIKKWDRNLKKIDENLIKIPDQMLDFAITQLLEDQEKNIYVLIEQVRNLKMISTWVSENYRLLRIDTQKKVEEFDLDLQKKYISVAKLLEDPEQQTVLLTGFYANDKMGEYAGVFLLKIQTDFSIEHAHFTKIPNSFFGTDKKNQINQQLKHYMLSDLYLKNGKIHLLAEQKYKEVSQRYSLEDSFFQQHYYHFLNIAYFILDETGQLLAAYRIPKKQITYNDHGQFSSYIAFFGTNNLLSFLFLDHPKNKNLGVSKPMNHPPYSTWAYIEIGENGKMRKQHLGEHFGHLNQQKIFIYPQSAKEKVGQIYWIGQANQGLVFGKLQIE